MKLLYKFAFLTLISIFVTSCKTDPLEDYFVKATESPDFFVMNIPSSILTFDETKLDAETKRQIKSIKKMNILVYKNDYDLSKKKQEFAQAEQIVNKKVYKNLGKINNDGYKVIFSYEGTPDKIDGIVFLGKDKKYNFLIGRLKAADVNINNLVKAMKHIKDVDDTQVKSVFDMIKTDE